MQPQQGTSPPSPITNQRDGRTTIAPIAASARSTTRFAMPHPAQRHRGDGAATRRRVRPRNRSGPIDRDAGVPQRKERTMKQLELAAAAAMAILAAGPLADASAAVNGTAPAQSPDVLSAVPKYTPAMRDLLDAAQSLRESIQVMAQEPAGAERDAAMDEARRALRQAQRSMLDLPPNLRSTGERIVDHRPAPISTSE